MAVKAKDTEKEEFIVIAFFIKDLECMIERYLEPLTHETFLPSDDVNDLLENTNEILKFQKEFCESLEQAINPNLATFTEVSQYKVT